MLAVFLGLLAIPAAVTEVTQWEFPYTRVSVSAVVGFGLYGLVLGSVFGKRVNRRPLRPLFLVWRTRPIVVASVVAGGVMATAAPHHLAYFAVMVGAGGSVPVGFALFVAFAVFPARRVERQDLPSQSGFKLGAAYGLVLVVLGVVVIPQFLGAATAFDPPRPRVGMLAGSLVLGVSYGVIERERAAPARRSWRVAASPSSAAPSSAAPSARCSSTSSGRSRSTSSG